jgi:hypothetical protein
LNIIDLARSDPGWGALPSAKNKRNLVAANSQSFHRIADKAGSR